jgi:hypothetical protein
MKLLHHPVRRAVLRIMFDTREPRSPVELAGEMDESLGNVGYHVRLMERHQAIRLVGEEPVSGSLKHYYVPGRLAQRNRALIDRILAADD